MGSNPILAASPQRVRSARLRELPAAVGLLEDDLAVVSGNVEPQSPLGGLAVLQVDVVQARGEPVRAAGVDVVVVAAPGDVDAENRPRSGLLYSSPPANRTRATRTRRTSWPVSLPSRGMASPTRWRVIGGLVVVGRPSSGNPVSTVAAAVVAVASRAIGGSLAPPPAAARRRAASSSCSGRPHPAVAVAGPVRLLLGPWRPCRGLTSARRRPRVTSACGYPHPEVTRRVRLALLTLELTAL
jgi:hypothetical protein